MSRGRMPAMEDCQSNCKGGCGYEVIDMQPMFVEHFRLHQEPFNWTRDKHWNSLGHGLCADRVAQSAVLRRMMAAPGEHERNW